MLLIYTDRQTNRLGYTLKLVFNELLGIDYIVTTDKQYFIEYTEEKLSYGEEKLSDELHIRVGNNILFETTIYSIDVDHFIDNGIHKIFRNYDKESGGFDIFAAVFYMVSRYEEYLPFIRDKHLRFCATDSIAHKYGFLEYPVVNIWAENLKALLIEKYPSLKTKTKEFSFINTIDIDQAYCYKNKGIYRCLGGLARDFKKSDFTSIKHRLQVLFNLAKDPWESYDYIINELKKHRLQTIFFILYSHYNEWDKNINVYNKDFQLLIKDLGDYGEIGLHPSYYSVEYPEEVGKSRRLIMSVIHKIVVSSRFHFLRFSLPDSYRTLIDCGITDDYSMGYSDCIGFRGGICSAYNFYDLDKDCETKLRIHPFEIMDVALKNGLKLNTQDAVKKISGLINETKKVNGEFISVWHNESLSDYGNWSGWRNVYSQQIDLITEK